MAKVKEENKCYTYFMISGIFDPDEITKRLGLEPYKVHRIGEKIPSGKQLDHAMWMYGKCEEYSIELTKQVEKTIFGLLNKIDELNQISKEFDVYYSIEIVPEIYDIHNMPLFDPSLEVMDFCSATRTHLDTDLYIYAK